LDYSESLLFEVSSTDLVTLGGVVLTLGVTALFAGMIPARRATRIDPWVALRAD
jgi:ABC-type antimicrobial peptide transport system permease subunit